MSHLDTVNEPYKYVRVVEVRLQTVILKQWQHALSQERDPNEVRKSCTLFLWTKTKHKMSKEEL